MSIRKNMISNVLLTSSAVLFPLITFPYVSRTLSSNSIGKYFFIDAVTQYFIIFSAVGIPYYGIREIAKVKHDIQKRSRLVAELLGIQVTLSLLFSLALAGLCFFVPNFKTEFGLVKIACISIIGSSFLMEWFYQGMENFSYITGRAVILKVINVVCILVLVKSPNDYSIYFLLSALLILVNAAVNFLNYLKNYHTAFDGPLIFKQHFRPLLILFSINVSVSIYAILDTIILGMLTNPENVSYYNVPLKVVRIFWMMVNGAGVVLIPRISGYFADNDFDSIQSVMQKSLSIVFLLAIPFCFFCLVFPDEIITIISGQKYIVAANALRVLSIVPLIIACCNVCGTQFLMPIGREKSMLHATLLGLLVSLALNFLLIPYLKFMGTAIACAVAESVVFVYILVVAIKHIRLVIDYNLLIQILSALMVTMLAKWLLTPFIHGWLLLAAGVAVYCTAFMIFQFALFKNVFVFSIFQIKKLKPV